jgi:hypothetical protein
MQNIIIAVLAALAAPATGAPAMQHAIGAFEVKMTPQAQDEAGGVAMARMRVDKVFSGGLAATASGEMLTGAGGVKGSAAYVLIERVTGTLDGKAGSFAFMHSATMTRGVPDQRIVVVPDSGTGALAGLAGSMTMTITADGHFYDLAYTLAAR